MNRIAISLSPAEGELPLGSSRLLGTPDVWEGFAWPSTADEEGEEYDLDFLCQINLAEVAAFDSEGLLPPSGILYFFYDLYDAPWYGEATVLHYTGDPEELMPCILLDAEGEELDRPALALSFRSDGAEGFLEGDSHFLLGHPSDTQQMGLGTQLPEGLRLLLQIDSFAHSNLGLEFGDTGFLCYLIDEKALAEGDFSQLFFVVGSY